MTRSARISSCTARSTASAIPPRRIWRICNLTISRKMAAAGESFVIVGRCAETALSGTPGLITLFILGDEEAKIGRIRSLHPELSHDEAKRLCAKEDWKRKSYHNYYCKGKWGDARTYDLTINSSRLGLDGTADALESYIKARIAEEKNKE